MANIIATILEGGQVTATVDNVAPAAITLVSGGPRGPQGPPGSGGAQAAVNMPLGNISGAKALNLASNTNVQATATLTGNSTVTVSGLAAGAIAYFFVKQNATGGWVLSISDGTTTVAIPGTTDPSSGFGVLLASPDGTNLYVTTIGGGGGSSGSGTGEGTAVAIPLGNITGAHALNLASHTNVLATATLTGNSTVTVSGLAAGMTGLFLVDQNSTGGYTLTISDGTNSVAMPMDTDASSSTGILIASPNGTDLYVTTLGGSGGGGGGASTAAELSFDPTGLTETDSTNVQDAIADHDQAISDNTAEIEALPDTTQAVTQAANSQGVLKQDPTTLVWPTRPTTDTLPRDYTWKGSGQWIGTWVAGPHTTGDGINVPGTGIFTAASDFTDASFNATQWNIIPMLPDDDLRLV